MNYYLVTVTIKPFDCEDIGAKFKTIKVLCLYVCKGRINNDLAEQKLGTRLKSGLIAGEMHKTSYIYNLSFGEFKKTPIELIVTN